MVELRDYQRKAVNELSNGKILVGGVGSGKSRTSLAYYFENQRPKDLYIITTARKRDTLEWEEECCPFPIEPKVVDSWNNIKKYVDVKDAFFIFDEQRVVGHGTWVKSFLKITRNNSWILLSATPGDTWTDYIPVFIANGFYRNRTEFLQRHAVYSRYCTRFPKIDHFVETGRLLRLKDQITVPMKFNRETTPNHIHIYTDYDEFTYKKIMRDRWHELEDRPIRDASELCQVLRRIVGTDPDRLKALRKLISAHSKVIIFYNFNYELELIRNTCVDLGRIYAEWNGHFHQPIPNTEEWCYLVQYNAGAEGWNCIETDTIIFYSQSYSYKQMVQAAGRIDRMNTPFDILNFYHLTSKAPIDRSIEYALKRKKNFNESKFVKW